MNSAFIRSQADLDRLVALGWTPESLTLEFKKDYGDRHIPKGEDQARREKRREGRKETARDIAQFANGVGGCLLIGVGYTKDSSTGMEVAKEICPVGDVDDLRRWVDDAVAEFVVQSTLPYEWVLLPQPEGGAVVAVNVPPSVHLATVWDRQVHTSEHLRRTHQGKAWMNPDEMERHLMNGSRAAYLKILSLLVGNATAEVHITDGHWTQHAPERPERWTPSGPVKNSVTNADSFLIAVPTNAFDMPSANLPYGIVEEAWPGVDGKLQLLLTKRLVLRQNRLELFPIG